MPKTTIPVNRFDENSKWDRFITQFAWTFILLVIYAVGILTGLWLSNIIP